MWMIRREPPRAKRPQYWSGEYGWTAKDFGDTFTEAVKQTAVLPKSGVWEDMEAPFRSRTPIQTPALAKE